jgi:hypothetical protein
VCVDKDHNLVVVRKEKREFSYKIGVKFSCIDENDSDTKDGGWLTCKNAYESQWVPKKVSYIPV